MRFQKLALATVAWMSVLDAASGSTGGFACGPAAPSGRQTHGGVWTGTEMIVWGGITGVPCCSQSGSVYKPATGSWRSTSLGFGVPEGRSGHTAVWTGTEMIIWGGTTTTSPQTSSGSRYDPVTNTWRPTATTNVGARFNHTAVWTGSAMVVWGGHVAGTLLYSGGRYDPLSDSWTPTSAGPNVPQGREWHTALWTGSEMIVWGGWTIGETNTGGRYDPVTDSWLPTNLVGAPAPRRGHTAVWTGTQMVVWGGGNGSGYEYVIGGTYSPATDSWQPTALAGAPSGRSFPVGVWDGTEVIVWGGLATLTSVYKDTGGLYDPTANIWKPLPLTEGLPSARAEHVGVWTGTDLLVWGGNSNPGGIYDYLNTGGLYNPASNTWRETARDGSGPSSRQKPAAAWTGSELFVWGGLSGGGPAGSVVSLGSGALYDPAADRWRSTPAANAPTPRSSHTGVWTGREVVVWGGTDSSGGVTDTGGRLDPVTSSWRPTSATGAPSPRSEHTAVWTGQAMIVWGGTASSTYLDTGGRYDPVTDTWTPTSTGPGLPTPRARHTAVWAGTDMIIWGGFVANPPTALDTGARYDPGTDTWRATSVSTNVPAARFGHSAVWTGTKMIVWGGVAANQPMATGAQYDPSADAWSPMATSPLRARAYHSALWTGGELLVWGGNHWWQYGTYYNDGARYDPVADAWSPMSLTGAPPARAFHACVFTGTEMLLWGGFAANPGEIRSGGRYDAGSDVWRCAPILAADVIVGKGPGGTTAYDTLVHSYRVDGVEAPTSTTAFPLSFGSGVGLGSDDVDGTGYDDVLAARGPGASEPPRVAGFQRDGTPLLGLSFPAYGTTGRGARVAAGAIDGSPEIVTGPGPSAVYGPHVRAFRYRLGVVGPISKVSFFAYGTLRYGAHVAVADLDGDGFTEMLTAPGPGVVFGPHVRGFDYDGTSLRPILGVSFFAYGTLRFGAEVGGGDMDGDGYGEILTGPGPSPAFAAHLRGFDVDGGVARAIGSINAVVFQGTTHGMTVAAGDLDIDGFDEIACGAGPDPLASSTLRAFDHDGMGLQPITTLSVDPFGLSYGLDVAVGRLGY